ncbi:MAG: P-II family nitrogen regulator [Gammaproteobacteria bacterium]|nr:MAG: P-II family nitrogen regulator [Gammaproteobacteria bacterium]
MKLAKVIAIIRPEVLERVEEKLKQFGVPGVSVSQVKGYGEYADFYRSDWKMSHTRVEVVTSIEKSEPTAKVIIDAAHTGLQGDGIVTITPISALYHIRSKKLCDTDPG